MEIYTPISREELVNLLTTNLILNLELNTPRSTFRRVLNNRNSQISVQIGQRTLIKLNYQDIINVYFSTIQNNGIYNKQICETVLPRKTRNHGCTVHVIGMIFVRLKLMTRISERNYQINKD